MLTILLLIPFLGALVISVLPSGESGRNRSLALLTLAVQCVVSFALLIPFQASETGQQLVASVPWLPVVGLDFSLGLHGLSLPLVLMNAVLCLVAALASRSVENRSRLYFSLILVISGAVNGAFLAQNLLLFFIFYELELIPLWLLIAIWGGANRAYASTKFLIITAVSGGGKQTSLSQQADRNVLHRWHPLREIHRVPQGSRRGGCVSPQRRHPKIS